MNDHILIEGLKNRERVVFDYIFNFYYSSLCAFCMQYFRNRSEVEDLVQDFFVSLWMEGTTINIRSSLKSYLFTSVKNRCLDRQKHQKVVEKYRSYILFSSQESEDPVEHYFAESELRQVVQKSLAKLSPRGREIFIMSRLNGLSNHEISDRLGISKRTVEIQISNSLKVLKRELAEYLPIIIIAWLLG